MTRLIDADELKDKLSKETNIKSLGLWLNLLQIIDNAPTVEAEITEKQAICFLINNGWLVNHDKELRKKWERPQGEWIFNITHWSCSACNETVKTIGYCGTKDFMSANFKFCPNCGAEMKSFKDCTELHKES